MMPKLHRITLAAYYEQYCAPLFTRRHYCYLDSFESEVLSVRQARITPRLYIVAFYDKTESIVDHNAICYIQVCAGIIANRSL